MAFGKYNYKIVRKGNSETHYGAFNTLKSAQYSLKEIRKYCEKGYFTNKALTPDDFAIVPFNFLKREFWEEMSSLKENKTNPLLSSAEHAAVVKILESFAPSYGFCVAFTDPAHTIYASFYTRSTGEPLDIILYEACGAIKGGRLAFMEALTVIGFEIGKDYGRVQKATFNGKTVNFIFPEFSQHAGLWQMWCAVLRAAFNKTPCNCEYHSW